MKQISSRSFAILLRNAILAFLLRLTESEDELVRILRLPNFGKSLMLVFALLLAALPAAAQTVINIPPANSPSTVGADTVVNVLPGGLLQVGNGVVASNGGIVNVVGGRVGELTIRSGAVANVVNGGINGRFWAEDSGRVSHDGGRTSEIFLYTGGVGTISGGAIETIGAVPGSSLTIRGVSFAIDGVPVPGLANENDAVAVNLPMGAVLTATLADGTPFGKFQRDGQQATIIDQGVLTLRRSADPAPATPGTINITNASSLLTARGGQTVVVQPTGIVAEQFRAGPGSTVQLEGGRIESAFHAIGANVLINSGNFGRRLNAYDNAVVTIRGGQLEGDAQFYRSSTFNIEGGVVGGGIWVWDDSTLNLSNGTIYEAVGFRGSNINISGGAMRVIGTEGHVTISGGELVDRVDVTNTGVIDFAGGRHGDFISVRAGGQMIVHASEVRINGAPPQGLAQAGDSILVSLEKSTVLSGVYPDGTPFVFSGDQESVTAPIRVIEASVPVAAPTVFHVPNDPVPAGVRAGQTLVLAAGGALPMNFTAGQGSTVRVEGGTVGNNFEADGATVDITGGSVGTIDAFNSTVMNIGGTAIFSGLNVLAGATANIHGGIYNGGNFFTVKSGALNVDGGQLNGQIAGDHANINISGGNLQSMALVYNSTATITGGKFSSGVGALSGSTIFANGGEMANLSAGVGDTNLIGVVNTVAYVNGAIAKSLTAHEYGKIEVTAGNSGTTSCYGGELILRGGALADAHFWTAGNVVLNGYGFEVDGVPIGGLATVGNSVTYNYTPGTSFKGYLSDGTPINLIPGDNFAGIDIQNGVLKLVRTATPTLPTTVHVADNSPPYGASSGQTIIVEPGGSLQPNFVAGRDSIVQIQGGTVGDNFEADRSQVAITGGTVGNRLDVFSGAAVTLSGGSIGEEFEVYAGGILNIQGGAAGRLSKAVGGVVNMSGGSLGTGFDALANSVVNISGGTVASEFFADQGSTVNVSGGQIGTSFEPGNGSHVNVSGGHLSDLRIRAGATVDVSGGNIDNLDGSSANHLTIRGGSFGDSFDIGSTTDANIQGQNFELDGVPIVGLDTPGNQATFNLASNRLFTGTLADGTPFAFRTNEGDAIGSVKLIRSADVPAGPAVIDVSSASTQLGVHAGQTLNLLSGGSLPANFNAGRGGVVNVLGGSLGENLEVFAATVNLEAGQVGANWDAFAGSQINIRGGSVGTNFDVYAQATVTMSGGVVARLDALADSTVRLDDGSITSLQATTGSHTIWKGGTMGALNVSGTGATLAMHGVDFQLNGVPVAGLNNVGNSVQLNLASGSILTATLANGTSVVLFSHVNNPLANAQIANGALTLVKSAAPINSGPAFQHITNENAPFWIGNGQTVLVDGLGKLPANFAAGPGSTIELDAGSIGNGLKATDADITIDGGNVGTSLFALRNTELNINGGTFAGGFSLDSASHAFVRGGTVPAPLLLNAGTIVDIYGTSFLFNNQPIGGLGAPGSFAVITQRNNQLLTGFLTDGKRLEWRVTALNQLFGMSSQATLRVHIIPEPATLILVIQVILATGIGRRRMRRTSMCD